MGVRHTFLDEFDSERRTIIIIAIIEIAILIVSAILVIFNWESLSLVIFTFAGIAILILLISINFLNRRYSKLPVVMEKKILLAQSSALNKVIRLTKSAIRKSLKNREKIKGQEKSKLQKQRSAHDKFLANLEIVRDGISASERQELETTLDRIQDEYFIKGLRLNVVRDAQISGVGTKMKSRLERSGIHDAGDVTVASVSAVKGFGESKTLSVVEWRRSVERMLNTTKPLELPLDVERSIRQRHKLQRDQTIVDEQKATYQLEQDLRSIAQKAINRHAQNDTIEVRAREKLE